jgi:hypothetical protein
MKMASKLASKMLSFIDGFWWVALTPTAALLEDEENEDNQKRTGMQSISTEQCWGSYSETNL